MDILWERYGLVQERLEEIRQEPVFRLTDRFWQLCCGLALGEDTDDLRFADYLFCGEIFGREWGRYYGLLYAQMMLVPVFRRQGQTELACACCELLVQLYRMVKDGEDAAAFRNTLYWFYSDYCELYISRQMDRIADGDAYCFCGPMMLMEEQTVRLCPVWRQHVNDYGLYMGSRFEERCYQAVAEYAKKKGSSACGEIVRLFMQQSKHSGSDGFGAAPRQAEGLWKLAGRIAAVQQKDTDASV